MPTKELATLRIHGNGEVPLSDISGFLSALEEAYSGVSLFITALDAIEKWGPYPYWELSPYRRRYASDPFRSRANIKFDARELRLSRQTPKSNRLVLRGVHLESPGWWDVIGKLNPLEVIRQGLNDRHERKKDHDYRNSIERERGHLENELLRNQVLAGRIDIARSAGWSEEDLAPLVNDLLLAPLQSLENFQNRGVVTIVDAPKVVAPKDDGLAV